MKTNKISPFTGGAVELCTEVAHTNFRGEEYSYISYYYRCLDTGRTYTDNELDNKSIMQVYDQYRRSHGIPFPEEIRAIRKQYGLPAIVMARILGLGDNQYRLYEEGTIPSESAGKLISLSKQKVNMLTLLQGSAGLFTKKDFNRYYDAIDGASAPIILPLYVPYYAKQTCSEQQTGQMITIRKFKKDYYKKEVYASAVGYK